MAAKFETSKDHAGKFRFHLKAPPPPRACGYHPALIRPPLTTRLNEPAYGVDVNDSPHSQPPSARPGPFWNAAISFCLPDGETA
jgi:hypothetical protein